MKTKMKRETFGLNAAAWSSRLAVRVFIILVGFVVLPLYLTAVYVRGKYESYFREELNTNIISTLSKNETEIEKAFDNLSNIANVYCTDDAFKSALQNDANSYYEKVKAFDRVTHAIELNSLSSMENVQVTMVDDSGEIYTNWSRDFHDYSFLKDSDIFSGPRMKNGNAVWQMFCEPFIYGDAPENKYIGISRGIAVISLDSPGRYLATVYVSIRQSELSHVLERFRYAPGDYISVYAEDGSLLLHDSADNSTKPELDSLARDHILSGSEPKNVLTVNGHTYLACRYDITRKWIAGNRTLSIFHFTDYAPVAEKVKKISQVMNTIMAVCLGLVLLIGAAVSWSLVGPIHTLAETMSDYDLRKKYDFANSTRRDEIGQLQRAFGAMDRRIRGLFSDLEKENRIKEEYKLNFLRAQLSPHFLFNTLGTIRWMAIAQHMTNIVECIDALGNMLNYSMDRGEEMITLREEVQNLEGYIKIQNYRYGSRYRIVSTVEGELKDCLIIRFLLQPVVENAVLHAFSNGEGEITIAAEKRSDMLEIVIADNGKGISPEMLVQLNSTTAASAEDINTSKWRFNKIGIHSIREQIQIRYGSSFGLRFESDGVCGTRCIYRLPLLWKKPEEKTEL
jgi:two-component system sensor histidine kinase YesM